LVKKAVKNLARGHRAIFCVQFKRRELNLKDVGREKMKYIVGQLEEHAILDKDTEDYSNIKYFFVPHKQPKGD